jgi:hypothetical protein
MFVMFAAALPARIAFGARLVCDSRISV